MTRRLRLLAAMALARVADWAENQADRAARSALGEGACAGYGDVFFGGVVDGDHMPRRRVSETGITRALAETESNNA